MCVKDTDTGICRVNDRVNTVVYAGRTVVYTGLHSVRRVNSGVCRVKTDARRVCAGWTLMHAGCT